MTSGTEGFRTSRGCDLSSSFRMLGLDSPLASAWRARGQASSSSYRPALLACLFPFPHPCPASAFLLQTYLPTLLLTPPALTSIQQSWQEPQ